MKKKKNCAFMLISPKIKSFSNYFIRQTVMTVKLLIFLIAKHAKFAPGKKFKYSSACDVMSSVTFLAFIVVCYFLQLSYPHYYTQICAIDSSLERV